MPPILILDISLLLPAPHPSKDRRLPELDTVLQLGHHSSTLSLKLLVDFCRICISNPHLINHLIHHALTLCPLSSLTICQQL